MKRFNRSALVAGVLALGVAACGDDVEIVQPTPPHSPAPAGGHGLDGARLGGSVLIGNSVVFAVNASGGVAGDAASWTCASSNSGIATVSVVSAGCQATGAAAGSVTITATVTKSGETVNVGAQLTVTEEAAGEPAFLIIRSVAGDDGTDASGLKGRVSVNLNVERGDQTLERLSVLVDGEVAAYQSFGSSMDDGNGMAAPADDAAAEQAVYDFTLSFDSHKYVEHGDHTDVDYMNGEHTISAELQIAGGMMADGMMGHQVVSSNVMTVEFDNDDGFVVSADLGDNSTVADDGKRWYGGPTNGHIMISALAVIYSGEEIGEVAISLEGCTAEAAEGDGNGNGDDDHGHAEGGAFEFDCEGEDAGRAITVTEGGNDANVLNEDDLPDANIDMEGPAVAPHFSPNPNNRQNGWVNLTVDFLGEQGSGSKKNGWLTYNAADDEPGVGGYQAVLRYAKAGRTGLEDALAAAPLSLTNLPSESEMDAYCAVVSAVDALGNESGLPDEDDGMCLVAGVPDADAGTATDNTTNDATGYEELLEALAIANRMTDDVPPATAKADAIEAAMDALADAGILVGVDITPPGIETDEDERINAIAMVQTGDGLSFDIYDDEHDDHNSGLHTVAPLLVRIQRRTTDETECLAIDDAASATATPAGTPGEMDNADDVSCTADPSALADGTAVTFAATPAPSHAYYTLSGAALDQAGNVSPIETHTFVFDATPATATAPAAPGALEAGESFQIASFLNDDLSIRDYYVTANFPDVGAITPVRLGIVAPTEVDAFDADPLTHRNFSVTANIDTYAGLQGLATASSGAPTADVLELATAGVAVRDQADSDGTNDLTNSPGLTVAAADDDAFATDEFTVEFEASEARLCVAEDMDDCDDGDAATDDDETETELEVVATAAATGAFSNPFERVDFWVRDVNGASWHLGSDTSGESGRVSSTDRTRTWTYSLDAAAANLYMLTREAAFTPAADSDTHTVLAFAVNDDGVALVASVDLDLDDGESGQ